MGTKITDLTALATAPDRLDVIAIVDVDDPAHAASGTTKKITIADLGFLASGDNISLLNNDSGFITSSDYSNSGEAAAGDRDLGNTNAFALSLITNGLGRINIEAGGDVGIGTSTPTAKLDVVGLSALNNIAILANSTTTGVGVDSIGLQGQSIATNGGNHYGVIGKALNGSNFSNGGFFQVESGASVISAFGTVGVQAVNQSTNSNFNYGVSSSVTSTSGTTYGIKASATGAATTNYGAVFSAENAVNNYALITDLGNVGIGTYLPTEKLVVAGNIKVVGNTLLGNNTNSLIGINDAVDPDTSIYLYGNRTNLFRFRSTSSGGTDRLKLTNSGALVGLDLSHSSRLYFTKPAIMGVDTAVISIQPSSGIYSLFTSNSTGTSIGIAARFSGNVGIGMNAASSCKFQVTNDTAQTDAFKVNTSTSNALTITDASGNVGIGTTTPTEKLEVVGNAYVNGLIGCNVSPIAGQALTINSTGSGTEKALQIRTVANIERFFIQGDGKSELTGRLGINDTTVQGAQNYMLWVKGDPSASKLFGLADNSGNLKMEMSSVGRLTLNSNDTGTQVGFGTNSAFSTTVGILGKTGNIYALKVGVGANVNKLNVKGNNDNYGVGIMVDGHDEANLKIGASTTTHSSINFVNGVAPTSPNNGDFWFDGTDLFIQVSGTTYTLTKT